MSNLDTETGLREFLESVVEMETETVLNNEMAPKFLWFDKENRLRLMAIANIDVDVRHKLAWGLKVLTAVQDEDTTLVYCFDGYVASANAEGKMCKHNGEPWGYGGMQNAVENQTEDADLVTECLNITTAQNGWVGMASVPYARKPDGLEFAWDEVKLIRESPDEMNAGAGGDFPTMLREATGVQRIAEVMAEEGVTPDNIGLPPNIARLHMLCAAVKHVGPQVEIQCAIPASDPEEIEVLNRSFSDVEGNVTMFDGEGNEVTPDGV